jgi:choline dehydrogenase-like flavoprotein
LGFPESQAEKELASVLNLPLLLDREFFDACVIGSGAAGGIAAKELTELGARVVVLERGEWVSPARFRTHAPPYELPFHGQTTDVAGQAPDGYTAFLYARRSSTSDPGGESIDYGLLPAVGGKTLLWDGLSWRFGERDFEGRAAGADWPIRYHDLEPFYERAERFLGVSGSREGLAAVPDGVFLKPLRLRCGEEIIRQAALSKLGRQYRLFPARKAVNTASHGGRPACHYCGYCERGCDIEAKYTSANSAIPAALATGRLTLATGSIAYGIELDPSSDRASAVLFINSRTRQHHRVRARAIALACGPVEDVRMLLMSKSRRFPEGLANSSGCVGKNLAAEMNVGMFGYLESLLGARVANDDGTGTHGVIANPYYAIPSPAFARGYMLYVNAQRPQAPVMLAGIRGVGARFKQRARSVYPALVQISGTGEILPHPENYVDLDPEQKDEYGLPLPRFHFRFHENEHAMAKDVVEKCAALLEACGGRRLDHQVIPRISGSHLVGLARMGDDPRSSVVNRWNRAHDLANLWIIDGGAFTSGTEKSPTLTVIACAMRAAWQIGEALRKGEV